MLSKSLKGQQYVIRQLIRGPYMLFQANTEFEDALTFSRFDPEHLLSCCSEHEFEVEGVRWSSVEHYYQAQKFSSGYSEKIRLAVSAQEAFQFGNKWFKRKRSDYKTLRPVLMTRAVYSKAIQNQEVKQFLLDSGEQKIAETSLFDHYWGIGRDQRGENMLGKVWMDVRSKIRSDMLEA